MPSMLFRSIRSLLPAKKAAITSPKSPPRPKTQAFFLLACFFVLPFFSVCSSSAVMTRRFEGRSDALGAAAAAAAAGEGSREGSDDVSPPPKRRLRKDMTATRGARGTTNTVVVAGGAELSCRNQSSSTCKAQNLR